MKEIDARMKKFSRLMGVSFKFNIVHHAGQFLEFNFNELGIKEDKRLQLRSVMMVEEEVDLDVGLEGFEFVKGFQECLRWFRVYFEGAEEDSGGLGGVFADRVGGAARNDSSMGVVDVWRGVQYSDHVRALLRRHKEGWAMS
ncbi:SHORT-ROOT protein [Spatholobus suberectus]|nr:SHORT-ROOT protein [Spatholobus suberectus]